MIAVATLSAQACVNDHVEDVSLADATSIRIIDTDRDPYTLALEGLSLAPQEAADLETVLWREPGDLAARTMLIGYYGEVALRERFEGGTGARAAREEHVMWLITHAPHAPVLASPYAELASWKGDDYEAGVKVWTQKLGEFPTDPRVRWNAASALLVERGDVARTLLEEGGRLEPGEPRWAAQLGQVLSLELRRAPSSTRNAVAQSSLDAYEEALARTLDENGQFLLMSSLAEAAFEAGRMTTARWYAEELLQLANDHPDDWNFGNAIHEGNIVLGRIALLEGNIEQAVAHLERAGATPGSPTLNSFGPDVELADALLKRGERTAVIGYLIGCARFWKSESLPRWIEILREDGYPNFQQRY